MIHVHVHLNREGVYMYMYCLLFQCIMAVLVPLSIEKRECVTPTSSITGLTRTKQSLAEATSGQPGTSSGIATQLLCRHSVYIVLLSHCFSGSRKRRRSKWDVPSAESSESTLINNAIMSFSESLSGSQLTPAQSQQLREQIEVCQSLFHMS